MNGTAMGENPARDPDGQPPLPKVVFLVGAAEVDVLVDGELAAHLRREDGDPRGEWLAVPRDAEDGCLAMLDIQLGHDLNIALWHVRERVRIWADIDGLSEPEPKPAPVPSPGAAAAYARGLLPLSKIRAGDLRARGIPGTLDDFRAAIKAGIVQPAESHATSRFNRATPFYDLAAIADQLAERSEVPSAPDTPAAPAGSGAAGIQEPLFSRAGVRGPARTST